MCSAWILEMLSLYADSFGTCNGCNEQRVELWLDGRTVNDWSVKKSFCETCWLQWSRELQLSEYWLANIKVGAVLCGMAYLLWRCFELCLQF